MTLFVSDCHLGRGPEAASRAAERDLLALLDAHEAALLDGGALFLVGDVFDQYIEYRHLVPKGFVRFQARLAALTDRGVPVTYVVGNRDPWHLDHFARELGVRVVGGPVRTEVEGHRAYIAHGDGNVASERLYNRLKPLLRSPFMARLYRMGLPGDAGFGLARFVARRFGGDGAPEAPIAEALRTHAERVLAETDTDLVVLGHSHQAACTVGPQGTYLNPGYWFADRTFARLDAQPAPAEAGGPVLLRWTGTHAEPLVAATTTHA
ncbi:MAG TPA: UDP-2,3-diacylglucosamine diphosphatase [Rubricoccaceae bacterium]|nr:UDP-2,3-diacylglucosamine diphosphatase [Rubricoccaceae bacterium]